MTTKKILSEYGVYTLVRPAAEDEIPVVLDSPHSGRIYPADFMTRIAMDDLVRGEDRFVDELFADAPDYGASFLMADFPRCYIDANRSEQDLEDDIFDGEWDGPFDLRPSDKARSGIGLIRRLFHNDQAMYDAPLPQSEILKRIDLYHKPYHAALQREIDRLYAKFGFVLHLNCHSMPEHTAPFVPMISVLPFAPFYKRADIVLGDRDGTSAGESMRKMVMEELQHSGFSVKMNDPFKGVEIVRRHGRPDEKRHSLQIEINRGLYLDRRERDKTNKSAMLKTRLDYFLRGLCKAVRGMVHS